MSILKPTLVFFLICSLLIPKSILHIIVHLPDIIEHFEEHKLVDNSSFTNFVSRHLTLPDKNQEEKHSDLPFNHEHSNLPDLQISMFNINLFQTFKLIIPKHKAVKKPILNDFKSFDFLKIIFQPPKMA